MDADAGANDAQANRARHTDAGCVLEAYNIAILRKVKCTLEVRKRPSSYHYGKNISKCQ